MSEEVAKHWSMGEEDNLPKREATFRRMRNALLSSTASSHFTQVMQRDHHHHHHRCGRRWQQVFQVPRLYREVRDEVADMHGWLMMQKTEELQRLHKKTQVRTRKLERTLQGVAWILGVPILILSYLQVQAVRSATKTLLWTLAALAFGAIAFTVMDL